MYREDLSPRVRFDRPVELVVRAQDTTVSARALNLSPSGMFVCAPVLLPVGTPVDVRSELLPGVELAAEATVVRTVSGDGLEPSGMGLRFDELDDTCAWTLAAFIDRRLQPGRGEPVRLQIGELPAPIRATTQGAWDGVVAVDAALPFLKLGSNVSLQGEVPAQGLIRWVEVHVCPETGVPRLNIGIQVGRDTTVDAVDDADAAVDVDDAPPASFDEDRDPICTEEYLAYARSCGNDQGEQRLRVTN